MNAMILAAGLGTRLKPWTLHHPKALVPVGGVPMLERVINNLVNQGYEHIVVNAHHFADQIKNFLSSHKFDAEIIISDESDCLLDTGGGILHASDILSQDGTPVLIHNVDILTDAPLAHLMDEHVSNGNDISLITNGRESSRKLIFDNGNNLRGWHNVALDEYRPADFMMDSSYEESAFSGLYIIGKKGLDALKEYAKKSGTLKFPIMDFFLSFSEDVSIKRLNVPSMRLIDIGKPDTLREAEKLFPGMK